MLPEQVAVATKENLVNRYQEIGFKIEELEAEKMIIREEIMAKLKDSGEVIGHFTVTKVERTNYNFSKITLDQARDLGAIKEAVDNDILKNLYLKKVKLPVEPTVTVITYPLIKEIESK